MERKICPVCKKGFEVENWLSGPDSGYVVVEVHNRDGMVTKRSYYHDYCYKGS